MPKTPTDTDDIRRTAPQTIDQRQQQIDPAKHHTADPNERSGNETKQPGKDPKHDSEQPGNKSA